MIRPVYSCFSSGPVPNLVLSESYLVLLCPGGLIKMNRGFFPLDFILDFKLPCSLEVSTG